MESNTENGLGRTDVVVKDRKNRRAIIIEAKHSKSEKEATSDCDKALKQIADNNYDKKLKHEYKMSYVMEPHFLEKDVL